MNTVAATPTTTATTATTTTKRRRVQRKRKQFSRHNFNFPLEKSTTKTTTIRT